eukprot:scaffold175784_cov32-Tisochrysis_lutea.AAC.4
MTLKPLGCASVRDAATSTTASDAETGVCGGGASTVSSLWSVRRIPRTVARGKRRCNSSKLSLCLRA